MILFNPAFFYKSNRYRAVTVGHYRDAVGAVLVFDITELQSFNNLDFWLEDLRKSTTKDCLIVIMPNKIDLVSGSQFKREVSEEQIIDYARINNLIYLGECSAKDDINVSFTLDSLIKQIKEMQKDNRLLNNSITRDTVSLQKVSSTGM